MRKKETFANLTLNHQFMVPLDPDDPKVWTSKTLKEEIIFRQDNIYTVVGKIERDRIPKELFSLIKGMMSRITVNLESYENHIWDILVKKYLIHPDQIMCRGKNLLSYYLQHLILGFDNSPETRDQCQGSLSDLMRHGSKMIHNSVFTMSHLDNQWGNPLLYVLVAFRRNYDFGVLLGIISGDYYQLHAGEYYRLKKEIEYLNKQSLVNSVSD